MKNYVLLIACFMIIGTVALPNKGSTPVDKHESVHVKKHVAPLHVSQLSEVMVAITVQKLETLQAVLVQDIVFEAPVFAASNLLVAPISTERKALLPTVKAHSLRDVDRKLFT